MRKIHSDISDLDSIRLRVFVSGTILKAYFDNILLSLCLDFLNLLCCLACWSDVWSGEVASKLSKFDTSLLLPFLCREEFSKVTTRPLYFLSFSFLSNTLPISLSCVFATAELPLPFIIISAIQEKN